jgi:excisionase family DNA binding protein
VTAQQNDLDRLKQTEESPALVSHGVTGLKRNSGYLNEEWHPKLKGATGRRKYREMADNSPILGASMWIIESLSRQVTWETVENPSGHPFAGAGMEFAETLFNDMETPWKESVSEILSFIPFGWSALEPEYKLRRGDAEDPLLHSKHDDGLFGWREWSPLGQEALDRWVFDSTGRLAGMIQRDPNTGATPAIPLDRMLLFRIRPRKNNPEGTSLFRTAYRPYYFATRHEDIQAIGVERNIAGMPDYQLPASVMGGKTAEAVASRDAAEKLVKSVRMDQYYGLCRPAEEEGGKKTGYKFSLLSSSGKSFADSVQIIQSFDVKMAMNFMTEFLFLGQGSSSTSYSAHSDKTNLLGMSVSALLDIADDITNEQALPRIWELNNLPKEAMPTRRHGDIEKKSVLETFQAVTQAVAAGAMQGDESVESMLRGLIDLEPVEGRPVSAMLQEASMAANSLGSVQTQPMADPMAGVGTFNDTTPTPTEPDPNAEDPGDDGPEWWTVEEAAENLRASPAVIRNAIKRGQLRGIPLGRTYRVNRAKLEELLSQGALV